jgi:hypothetical protein
MGYETKAFSLNNGYLMLERGDEAVTYHLLDEDYACLRAGNVAEIESLLEDVVNIILEGTDLKVDKEIDYMQTVHNYMSSKKIF